MWLIAAFLSAFFAGITAILAKCGIKKTDADVTTVLRTCVVLLFSWIMVFITGSAGTITEIGGRSMLFLILSGLATGASWICYFRALSLEDVNKVAPIDKSSTILTVLLAIVLFHETDHLAAKLVCTLVLAIGTFLMTEKKKTTGGMQKVVGLFMLSFPRYLPHLLRSLLKLGSREWNQILVPRSGPASSLSWPGSSSLPKENTRK